VAEDIFIRLKSISSGLNLALYIKTEDVLAVPDPPINKIDLLQIVVLGWFKIKSYNILALKES
jgi:hypothetical protein